MAFLITMFIFISFLHFNIASPHRLQALLNSWFLIWRPLTFSPINAPSAILLEEQTFRVHTHTLLA